MVGECLPFIAEFRMRGPALAKMSAADFRQAVAVGPTPTDQCCRDAKAFATQASALSPVERRSAPESMQWTTGGSPSLQQGRAQGADDSAPKERSSPAS